MATFGHMAKLEMEERGLREQGTSKDHNWPIVRDISKLATFQFPNVGA
jgi:hypothetical protein